MSQAGRGGDRRIASCSDEVFPYQIRSIEIPTGIVLEAYGGPFTSNKADMQLWHDGWFVGVIHRSGGYFVAEKLSDKLAAVDAMLDELMRNGGTGFIPYEAPTYEVED